MNGHNLIQTKCGKYPGIRRGIMAVPHNIIMDLTNVMEMPTKSLLFIKKLWYKVTYVSTCDLKLHQFF